MQYTRAVNITDAKSLYYILKTDLTCLGVKFLFSWVAFPWGGRRGEDANKYKIEALIVMIYSSSLFLNYHPRIQKLTLKYKALAVPTPVGQNVGQNT